MSRKNLNRRHLNFLARQAFARERRFREATRTLQRRTRETAEARRVSARRSEAAKRSAATTRCDLSTPPPLNGPGTRGAPVALPTLRPTPLPSAAQPPEIQTAQNRALRPHISETVRQFLMTLPLHREAARIADYIAVWNQNLPGLSLTPERLEAYRTTPPNRKDLVDLIMGAMCP